MKTSTSKAALKTLKASDNASIEFGTWFDKLHGNTYFDAIVEINGVVSEIEYRYGRHAETKQGIDEVLADIGYRVRSNSKNVHKPYSRISCNVITKSKRELFTKTVVGA